MAQKARQPVVGTVGLDGQTNDVADAAPHALGVLFGAHEIGDHPLGDLGEVFGGRRHAQALV